MKKLIIIGAGGHGKVAADIASQTYESILFLDDGQQLECMGYPVVGTSKDCALYVKSFSFFVAIGNSRVRKKVTEMLESYNADIVTLIHPHATISKTVAIGSGSIVMAGAVINPCVTLGKGCIVNTCSSIDHDCIIADYVHVSVGAHLAGCVSVGEHTWIGAGATVSNNISITKNCMIGAGAVVVEDIFESDTYICVPAKKMSTVKCGRK